jgi:hypothetical protein
MRKPAMKPYCLYKGPAIAPRFVRDFDTKGQAIKYARQRKLTGAWLEWREQGRVEGKTGLRTVIRSEDITDA